MTFPCSSKTMTARVAKSFNFPVVKRMPNRSNALGSRNVETAITFSIPSLLQKRFWANGRSALTHRITVLVVAEAFSLKALTDLLHVGVSMLGKRFKTTFFPWSSLRVSSDKSFLIKTIEGHASPSLGNSPFVCTGFPPSITWAINSP